MDETPIGTFLEIEGPVATIHEAARALGRGPQDYIARLLRGACSSPRAGAGDMVFRVKAMVLAAGLGTRMRPLTLDRAKPVLPVLNRPLLHWTLEMLARARRARGDGQHPPPARARCAPPSATAAPSGSRCRIRTSARSWARAAGRARSARWIGDEPLLLLNGDVVFDFDLTAAAAPPRARRARRATLALMPNPDPRRYSAVITGPDGRVRVDRRPAAPGARHASRMFTGVHVLDPALLDRLPPGPSDTVRQLYAPLHRGGRAAAGRARAGPVVRSRQPLAVPRLPAVTAGVTVPGSPAGVGHPPRGPRPPARARRPLGGGQGSGDRGGRRGARERAVGSREGGPGRRGRGRASWRRASRSRTARHCGRPC